MPEKCPKCQQLCLYDTETEIFRCLYCQQQYRKDGERIEQKVYSTTWFNLQGVQTQAQIREAKQHERSIEEEWAWDHPG